jgi:hypothetical protein
MHPMKRLGSLAAFLPLLAAVASACGNSVVNNDGGCADTGHCVPVCPDYPPTGACSVEGQTCGYSDECQYRVDVTCTAGVWEQHGWHDSTGQWDCTCDNSCETCPAAPPTDGAPCNAIDLSCDYPNPACAEATISAFCDTVSWHVSETGPACVLTCPATLPVPGTACDGCCIAGDCSFLDASGCPSHIACQNGVWATTAELCTPTSPCAALSMSACSNAQGCRWMALSGCPSTWQNFPQGCYPVTDCTSDADCNGGTCQPVEVDPCPAGDCSACSLAAKICIP